MQGSRARDRRDDGTKEGELGQWDGECVDGRRSRRTCFVCVPPATANVATDVSKFIIFDGTTEAGLGDSARRYRAASVT